MSASYRPGGLLCPECGHIFASCLNAVTLEDRPSPGDIGVCMQCLAVLRLDTDDTLRALTLSAFLDMDLDRMDTILKMRVAARRLKTFGGHANE